MNKDSKKEGQLKHLDDLLTEPEKEPFSDQEKQETSSLGRDIGRTAKSVVTTIAGQPGDIQSFAEGLISKALGVDMGEARSWLESQGIDVPGHFPTSSELRSGVEKKIPELAPQTEGEAKYEEAVELASGLAGGGIPGTKLGKAGRVLAGTALGMGAKEAASSVGAEPGTQEFLKSAASIIPMVLNGSVKPSSPSMQKKLYEAGKKLGFSEETLAPLAKNIAKKESAQAMYEAGKDIGLSETQQALVGQSEGKIGAFGKSSEGHKKVTSIIKEIKEVLGDAYEKLKQEGKSSKRLIGDDLKEILADLQENRRSLSANPAITEQAKKTLELLDSTISNIVQKGVNAEELINLSKTLKKEVGWGKKMKAADIALAQAQDSILKAIEKIDPKISSKLRYADRIYAKIKNLEQTLDKSSGIKKFLGESPEAQILSQALTGKGYAKAAKTALGIRPLSVAMLTNPKLQNVFRESSKALVKQSPKLTAMAYKNLKKAAKTELSPEEYDEIEWPM